MPSSVARADLGNNFSVHRCFDSVCASDAERGRSGRARNDVRLSMMVRPLGLACSRIVMPLVHAFCLALAISRQYSSRTSSSISIGVLPPYSASPPPRFGPRYPVIFAGSIGTIGLEPLSLQASGLLPRGSKACDQSEKMSRVRSGRPLCIPPALHSMYMYPTRFGSCSSLRPVFKSAPCWRMKWPLPRRLLFCGSLRHK